MSRQISHLAAAFAFIIGACFACSSVFAGNRSPIYNAAHDYREAVRAFERQVLRTPRMPTSVERLVDDLEDSTSRLRSASHDPARFDRLMERFLATDQLHARVQLTFFGDPLCPPGPELESCWIAVDQAYANLSYEIRYLQQIRNIRRGNHVPIVDHGYTGQVYQTGPPTLASPINPSNGRPFYQSTYAPTFRPETYGPRPALSGRSPTPALNPQTIRPAISAPQQSVLRGPTGVHHGAQIQRSRPSAVPTQRIITTREGLRAAVTGALLQRQ